MAKQDRQGVRTAVDLERKYGFGKTFEQLDTKIKGLEETRGALIVSIDIKEVRKE